MIVEPDKKLLAELDKFLMPGGELNEPRFEYLFDIYAGDLSSYTEPDEESEDWEPWNDSTMKHQIFDYWPTNRIARHPNFELWKNWNDLAWVLADYAPDDDWVKGLRLATRKWRV
jgi:hypothetical protein